MNLADRIEAATGPDRLLDANIHWLVARDDFEADEEHTSETYCYARSGWTMNRADHAYLNSVPVPRYTASLDAAMMLVGKDWYVEIKGPRRYLNIPTPVPNHWSANLETWDHEGQKMGWGATPALALAAAAIRAKGIDDV